MKIHLGKSCPKPKMSYEQTAWLITNNSGNFSESFTEVKELWEAASALGRPLQVVPDVDTRLEPKISSPMGPSGDLSSAWAKQ